MRFNEPLSIKLYDKNFTLQAIIDDYNEISFAHNLYEAGDFSISINYNIPNALLFQRGMFIQFGNDEYMFGEILSITDTIAQDGKGSQVRTITGKDARFLFKRRVIKNMNSEGSWVMTAKGELCMRNLIADQCGINAEEKRRLPIINNIPSEADALGASYSVSESFSNLYDTLVTIATQSEIGWRVRFTGELTLEVYSGTDLSNNIQFSTDFDSLANGTFTDTSESFANSVYVAGKGTGEDRDVYEGEIEGAAGLDRYEAFDNQSGMTTESEYETEALSMLSQYGQTITVNGNGLAKCPYIFKEQYNIGDIITIAFSGKSAKTQILGVTEHWGFGSYGITFSFGKPVNDLNRQLQLILKQIQKASNKTTTTSSVKYYTIPTDTEMPAADVIYDTIGFTGTVETGATFKLYLDNERTGAKTYHVRFKQLGGTGKLTLTTGVMGASNLVMNSGTYVAIIYVDNLGNVTMAGATATNTVEAGNNQPVTSDGVNTIVNELETEISGKQNILTAGANIKIDNNVIEGTSDLPTDAVLHYSFDEVPDYPDGTADVRLLNNNTYDIQGANYYLRNNGGSTFSNNNGNLKVSTIGGNLTGCYFAAANIYNKIVKTKIKVASVTGTIQVIAGQVELLTISSAGEYELTQYFSTSNSLYFYCVGAGNSCEFTFEQIYIGNGSYNTPIIDNANGQNNATNNGGIAVKGVSGKGYCTVGENNKLVLSNGVLPTKRTFSIWVYLPNNAWGSGQKRLWRFNLANYVNTDVINNIHRLTFISRNAANTSFSIPFDCESILEKWTHIVIIDDFSNNGGTKTVYINGSKINQITCTGDFVGVTDSSPWTLFSFSHIATNGSIIGLKSDDLLIFNRALTEKEVVALYNNKANTPKYYNLNNYKLPAPPTTDGSYMLNVTVSGGVPSYSWS